MTMNDLEIFKGKTFQDLTKDIYENSHSKKLQLDLLIQEMHGFITSIDDAVLIMPVIKEIVDVAVKNDEHLVKLASVLQRILTRSQGETDDTFSLTEQEKEDLVNSLQETANDIQKESDKINMIENKAKFMDS